MANDLFDLFRDKMKVENDLVATEPHTLDTLSKNKEEQELLLDRVSSLETVELKVDYSDFSNFVFFNSALDYFNITGEKILNEYPFDGACNEIQRFELDLDKYQRHAVSAWPKVVGHLRFDPTISASFITVEDIGDVSGVSKNGILSPGTGSLTVEVWYEPSVALTGTDDFQMLVQKMSGSSSAERYGYSLFLTGSNVTFMVRSGSVANSVSAPFAASTIQYVAGIMDRGELSGSLSILTGSQKEFPVVVQTASIDIFEALDVPAENLHIGSGTLEIPLVTAGVNVHYTGSLDDVRIWSKARTTSEISSSFNVKQFAQTGLIALYRFNESGSAFEKEDNSIVIDYSGRKLNGRITDYYAGLRHSGTFLVREDPDLILNLNTSDVSEHISEQQTSGSDYDRGSSNKITDMLPENFFKLEAIEQGETDILKNFILIAARHFDIIKTNIDQFLNVLRQNYGDFNQTPDAILDVVAKFFGWEFTGNFLNADAFQYLIGRSILKNVQTNQDLDLRLYEIKNEFWKRVLLNLMHIYKTKGTRESVKALLRTYGVNDNFVRIKEFGHTPDVGIQTKRINAEKSVAALGFGSGSFSNTVFAPFSTTITGSYSVEARVRFPLTSSAELQATRMTGSIWQLTVPAIDPVSGMPVIGDGLQLRYVKDSLGSHTGTLILSGTEGVNLIQLSGAGIFNNDWHNISAVMDNVSSSLRLEVRSLDIDELGVILSASSPTTGGIAFVGAFTNGNIGAQTAPSASDSGEYWLQEFRVWNDKLDSQQLDDHALNFQSYGVCDAVDGDVDRLILHLRLNEDIDVDGTGLLTSLRDVVPGALDVSGSDFATGINPYKKFLNDYNYIASMDFGWGEDKVRIFDSSVVEPSDFVNDSKIVSLEFNLMDALNEDIVQMLKSLDQLNEVFGFPANKYRVQYDDLDVMRFHYFKRLQGRLNFTTFANMLDFFDRSFIDMVKRLIPARAFFIGDEFVVESHMLERPKVTYERRKNQEMQFIPEGKIEAWTRFTATPTILVFE